MASIAALSESLQSKDLLGGPDNASEPSDPSLVEGTKPPSHLRPVERSEKLPLDAGKKELDHLPPTVEPSFKERKPPNKKAIKRVMDFYAAKNIDFSVEFRPNKRKSNGEWVCTHRLTPEDTWTTVKRIDLDVSLLRSFRENPDLEPGRLPDIYKVENEGNFFIGMDGHRGSCVVTDRNPHLEGLLDIHRCVYLPSAFEKNQTLPGYLTQNIMFMELPNATLCTPGVAPGVFFVTPRLLGCNIFVAHDPGLHKFWVLRISGKNPQKPPDIKFTPNGDILPKHKTFEEKTKEDLLHQIQEHDGSSESNNDTDTEEKRGRFPTRKHGFVRSQRSMVQAATKNGGPSSSPLIKVKLGTNEEEVIIHRDRFEAEKLKKTNNRLKELNGAAEIKGIGRQIPEDWVQNPESDHEHEHDLLALKRRYKKSTLTGVEMYGNNQYSWRPPTAIRKARAKEIESIRKPKSWAQFFREYRGYAECVLDYFRTQGHNAHFILRVATDRHWVVDVRDQEFWLKDVNKINKCNHYMYRGEGIFYGVFQDGTWKFGLKDLNTSHFKSGVQHRFPLEGQLHGHAFNCDVVYDRKKLAQENEEREDLYNRTEENFEDINRQMVKDKAKRATKRATVLLAQGNLMGLAKKLDRTQVKDAMPLVKASKTPSRSPKLKANKSPVLLPRVKGRGPK